MIISLGSKGLLATAIVLSIGIVLIPTATRGQTADNAQPAAVSGQSPETVARQVLFQARQSIAYGDIEKARALVEKAKNMNVDFQQLGDSPEILNSMIQRQEELLNMYAVQDPKFNAQAASFLLLQAEALLPFQDFETAESLIQQAAQFKGVEFNSTTGTPEQMLEKLQKARQQVDAQAVQQQKAKALSCLSQAQLAIDQERWEDALALVTQAKELNVNESEYSANDPRPWQLELKIQNAMSRRAGKTNSEVAQSNFNTGAFVADPQAEGSRPVVQAAYDPAADTTKVIQVAAEMELDREPAKTAAAPSTGMEFYNEGLKALTVNDRDLALAHFKNAWKNREELEGSVRLAIKTHLEKLEPNSDVLKATLASQETEINLSEVNDEQRKAFSALQSEIMKERQVADELLKTRPRDALMLMQSLRGKVAQSTLDSENQRPLLVIIDRDIAEMQKYIDQNLPEIMNDEANADAMERVERERQHRQDVEMQLQKLVDKYNQLIKEKRYEEAGKIVEQATEIAPPNSELVALLTEKHRVQSTVEMGQAIRKMKADAFSLALWNTERASIAWDEKTPLALDPDLEGYSRKMKVRSERLNQSRYKSAAEMKIYNLLDNETVQGEFSGTLSDAMDQLAQQMGVTIVFDELALKAENINRERPVNVMIRSPISFKSSMEVILQQVGLVFVVENEVIKVTSKDSQQSKMVNQTYYMGDLVMPMSQNPDPFRLRFLQPGSSPAANNGAFAVGQDNAGVNNWLGLAQQLGQNNPESPFYRGGPQTGVPTYIRMGDEGFGGITANDFQPLIDLITNTIGEADKWSEEGDGVYSIRSFPANLSLIISAPQEIHDEVQALMKKLRELNDVQIVIEVRFLTLNENFFEKIGIDFDFSINDDSGMTEGQAVGDRPPGRRTRVVGRTEPDGTNTSVNPFTPTPDLDLRYTQGFYSAAVPQFGGTFVPGTAGNFGFAILSDIEVFFLIQAAKQDNRSVITQAPTVTMFNGQGASIFDGSSRPFVTSVIPVVGDFAVAHQPIITILPDGTNLNVQAVVSEDRRFVRLNLVPMFSQISEVKTFQFDGSTTTRRTSETVLNDLLRRLQPNRPATDEEFETVTSGVTIQLPVITSTTISTVVSVPDGGTVLLGGIKRMSEGRSEGGLPLLSNIPFVNRLFRNTAIGHTTSNQMMMVTPRIIIQKEIEEDTVGIID